MRHRAVAFNRTGKRPAPAPAALRSPVARRQRVGESLEQRRASPGRRRAAARARRAPPRRARAAAMPSGPSSVEATYTSAPEARTSAAAASRPAMPPQREIFRHTASADAGAERPGLGGGLVDRDAHRHALAHLAHAPRRPWTGSSTSSRPAGASASIARDRLLARSRRRWRPGAARRAGRPRRAPPRPARRRRRCRPSASRHSKPALRGARRLLGGAGAVERRDASR